MSVRRLMTTTPTTSEAPPGSSTVTVPTVSGPTRRWWVRPGRPAWSLPAMASITVLAAVLYTWGLSRNGMGNSFYAAAVKSGTESWRAFFFGSLDPGSFITVDKPPASLWVMELSGRIFGFSTWSMLVPQAAAGVASVLILYRVVRRWMGEVAAVLAALALALTPIAVVMFRLNNPDAFLTLLLVAAAWALWSALETARTSRLVLSGLLLGLAFTTKSLQAFIVLPAFGLVYLLCGSPRLRRRVVQLLWAGLALVVSSSWWVVIVELWPTATRPYVGGSTNNSELNLIFGYNGFGRLFGTGAGPAAGGGAFSFGSGTGPLRMFGDAVGGQVAWLLPLALVGLVAGLWMTRRARRADLVRAGYVLWGGWTLWTVVVFSETKGIFHPYYTVALAPGVAALAGGGAVSLWNLGRRSRWWAAVLPIGVLGSAVWAAALLRRTPGYHPGLSTAVVVGGVLAAIGLGLVLFRVLRITWLAIPPAALAGVTLLAGPAAYSVTSVNTATGGALASAGPASAGGLGGGPAGFGRFAGAQGSRLPAAFREALSSGRPRGLGGFAGGEASVDKGLVSFLTAHVGSAKYLVAVSGSMTAAPFIIATGKPVVAMGGFIGSDPAPTLSQFKHLVAIGQVHYVLVGGGGPGGALAGGPGGIAEQLPGGVPGRGPSGLPGGVAGGGFPGALEGRLPQGPGSGLPPGLPSAGMPGFRGGGSPAGAGDRTAATSVDQWVQQHGKRVPAASYGSSSTTTQLYYVSSQAVA